MDFSPDFDPQYLLESGNSWFILPIRNLEIFREAKGRIEAQITTELLRPYYLRHFRDLIFWESATPIDYGAVVADTYFRNIIDYRLAALRSNQLDSYAQTAAEIRGVLELIDKELAQHKGTA